MCEHIKEVTDDVNNKTSGIVLKPTGRRFA
jgi:hypothetical protein